MVQNRFGWKNKIPFSVAALLQQILNWIDVVNACRIQTTASAEATRLAEDKATWVGPRLRGVSFDSDAMLRACLQSEGSWKNRNMPLEKINQFKSSCDILVHNV